MRVCVCAYMYVCVRGARASISVLSVYDISLCSEHYKSRKTKIDVSNKLVNMHLMSTFTLIMHRANV